MHQSGVTVGLDIGTTMIKVVVSSVENHRFNVIATGSAPSQGIKHGVVIDINATAAAVKAAIKQAEDKANLEIDEVVLGLPANNIEILNADGLVSIANQNKRITYQDVANVTEQALSGVSSPDKAVIDLIPQEFIVDGFDGIQDPSDMIGVRLEMHALAYLGPNKMIENIRTAVQKAGLSIREFTLAPLAMGESILDDGEQDFGSVLIDLAGGQSTASVVHDHKLKFTFVDPEGGDNITKDISTVLGISYADADKIKKEHGYADPDMASADETFMVNVIGQKEAQSISEAYLSQIIAARLAQIYDRIKERLEFVGAMELPGGFIITGGNTALPGSLEFARATLGDNVHLTVPDQIGLRHPAYARALAYTLFDSRQSELDKVIKQVVMEQFDEHAANKVTPYHQVRDDSQVIEGQASQNGDQYYEDADDASTGFFGRIRNRFSNLFSDDEDE
ncbi:cell division protein FtsA [Eupransor demetentiae]|uniref:Cell division protein FtsA n=1 Tax=Eupransor demetentiae TaxID=3109584 RepID=A0ABM9N4V4_9LACO|nr:Cell division ATPase FtsA (FtsA) [Lactobacillaceae bacterium LMG 33000]